MKFEEIIRTELSKGTDIAAVVAEVQKQMEQERKKQEEIEARGKCIADIATAAVRECLTAEQVNYVINIYCKQKNITVPKSFGIDDYIEVATSVQALDDAINNLKTTSKETPTDPDTIIRAFLDALK